MTQTIDDAVRDPRSLGLHEVCQAYPRVSDAELDELGRSMLEIKLLVPIVVHRGLIIDGASRWIAGLNAGYTFRPQDFREWEDECSIATIAQALNSTRRHLTDDQRRAVAVDLRGPIAREHEERKRLLCAEAGRQGGRGKKRVGDPAATDPFSDAMRPSSTEEAARLMGVGPKGVRQAAKIKEASPETFEAVKSGAKTIRQAGKELGLAPGRHRIPLIDNPGAGGTVATREVYVPEPDLVTRLEDIREDHAERAAIRDQDSDDAWVEGLLPFGVLQGKRRDDFARDAKLMRAFWREGRPELKARVAELLPGNRAAPRGFQAIVRALEQSPPERWAVCPPLDEGGCGGEGTVAMPGSREKCEKCWGSGYLVRP